MSYLDSLNPPQRQAVMCTEGPVMIVAGAGSGKTRVLTYRIAWLLDQGADPYNILALTFTNKAAREMRERIEKVVGSAAKSLWMGTFHSVFSRILRANAERLGYPQSFSIYDTDDAKSLISTIVKEMKLDDQLYKASFVYNRISSAKNGLIGPELYAQDPEIQNLDINSGRPKMAEVYRYYQERLRKAGAMDFDDLLFNTYKLFHHYPECLHYYQHKFKYLMVDEYQDTNVAQYRIVKMLAAVHENLCVVGDDAQSIYAFRGANIENILNFQKDYPSLQVFKLEQNYRSTQHIVQAANSLIAKNKDQLTKNVWTDNAPGDKIRVIRCFSDNEEGKLIAQTIFEEKMKEHRANHDFAILYRTNAQSRALEEGLRRLNIPYRIYGGTSFYHRKEIKDVIAYLKLIVNPQDEEAFKRIINYPARGIGKVSLDKMIVLADEHQIPLFDVASQVEQLKFGTGAAKIMEFSTMIKSFMAESKKKDAYETALWVVKQTGLQKELFADKTPEGRSRYENVEELLNGIKEYVEQEENEEKDLSAFLQNIALLTDADNDSDEGGDKVVLMTIHAAKGLEFPVVFIAGLEENLFPSQLSMNTRAEMEEERRLFYVAITRAEKKLFLTWASSRFRYGTLIQCEPSRFIGEINQEFLHVDIEKTAIMAGMNTLKNKKLSEGEEFYTSGPAIKVGGVGPLRPVAAKPKPIPAAPLDPNFVPDDTSNLQEGQWVEHQKFGKGKVTKMEGFQGDRKANILFEQHGEKQLVLKFAKLKIIQP